MAHLCRRNVKLLLYVLPSFCSFNPTNLFWGSSCCDAPTACSRSHSAWPRWAPAGLFLRVSRLQLGIREQIFGMSGCIMTFLISQCPCGFLSSLRRWHSVDRKNWPIWSTQHDPQGLKLCVLFEYKKKNLIKIKRVSDLFCPFNFRLVAKQLDVELWCSYSCKITF